MAETMGIELARIITRLVKATQASDALNLAIWVALHPGVDPYTYNGDPRYKNYTGSVDNAMELIPEGFDWILARTNGGLTTHAEVGGTGPEFQKFGETPALALCAAALAARLRRLREKV